MIDSLIIALFLCSTYFLFKYKGKSASKLNLPPSPRKLPLIGHIHSLGKLPHRSLRALSQKHGPLMLLQLGRPTVVVTSVAVAQEVMRTHDIPFSNRPKTWATSKFFYGGTDVGFSPYGEYWKQVRRIGVAEFWNSKSVESFSFVRNEEVEVFVEKIRSACLDQASFDLGEEMINLTVNVISRCVLGRKYEGENGKRSVGELSKMAMELIGEFCFRDISPSLAWIDVLTGMARRLNSTSQEFDDFLNQAIQHQKGKLVDKGNQASRRSFIESLLHYQKKGNLEISLTPENIKALLQDMFIGGTDTVATAMEWAMTELMRHPTTMKKVQDEVRRVVGQKRQIKEDDINQMDYLKCVIKETLRLHAPAPLLNARESGEEIVKLQGYDIPPRTRLFVNAWAIQRDPKLWDKPGEFIPERFAGNQVDFYGQDLEFMPFGSGRRICPGMLFGVTEIEHVLASILYWFDWGLPIGVKELDVDEVFGLVAHKKVPLQLVPAMHYT